MHSQTKIFSRRVKDYMRAYPLVLEAHEKLPALLAGMAEAAAESALVVGSNGSRRAGRLVGIVTERDVARRIALRATGEEEVQAVMTPDPYHVDGDDYPEMIIDWYKTAGYHFVALSEHNTLAEGERFIDVAENGGQELLDVYKARFSDVEERHTDDGVHEVARRGRGCPRSRELGRRDQ